MSRKSVVAIVVLAALAGGCWLIAYFEGWFHQEGVGPRVLGPGPTYSNVLPADYVGPNTCGACHTKEHRLWSTHPHRFMNQLPTMASIKGDFADHVWHVRTGYTVTFSNQGKDYLITVDRPAGPRTRFKVTRTIGSRFVQYYVGVQVEGPEPGGDRVYTTEHKMPFGYWFRMKRWLPAAYFDVGEQEPEELRDGLPVVEGVDRGATFLAYTKNCIHCHNTYPHAYRIFRPSLSGFPDAVIAGDFGPLSAALADRIAVAPNADAFAEVSHRLDPNKDLITIGISCESCHMGGREHATLEKDISFFPTSPYVHVTARSEAKPFTGKRQNPATSQGICAQCHSASGIVEHPNGARVRNSAEAKDLRAGACTTRIRCVSCHEPHTPGVPSGGPTLSRHLQACVNCHPQYAAPEQANAHSRHMTKTNVDCLDCHMPRISQGLDEVSRTHRISLPVEQSMVAKGAPNACNICHLDKSVRWTLAELKKGWGQEIRPPTEAPAKRLDEPAGQVWLKSPEPIMRIIAADAYSRSPLWKSRLADILNCLNDSNPPNRSFALFAVERILGRPLAVSEMDILSGPAERRRQIGRVQELVEKKR